MNSKDLVVLIVVVCFFVSFALSIRTACLKLPFFDRFSPIILQIIIAVITLLPVMHGSPGEWFGVMILIFWWSLFAFVSAYRLYRHPFLTLKILAFS